MFLCPVVEPTPVNAVTEWVPSGTTRGRTIVKGTSASHDCDVI
jgi:hypothetical protein